jgi:tRNA pseudouridine13 synthase
MQLPYLTATLPGIGGVLKKKFDDFVVHEVPLYQPNGVGTHCYFQIEKRGISTMDAARIVARNLGRKTFDVGYAGLKDTRAVTTQWFSLEHEETARVRALELPPGLKITAITRHKNKIKMGHLAGNRFVIKVRNEEWTRIGSSIEEPATRARNVIAVLEKTGVPNFFGPQRFGMRKDNHLLGLALLTQNHQDFVNRFLGDPDPTIDHGAVLQARQVFKNGNLEEAIKLWPGHLANERRALIALLKGKNNPKRAVFAVDLKLKDLLVSAFQSYLFNLVLTRRLPKMATVLPGDLCWKHDNGSVFRIGDNPDDAMKEQPRADAHEISPTGPMFGSKMSEAASIVKVMEDSVLKEANVDPASFGKDFGMHGARRSLRFFPKDLQLETGTDDAGPFLQLAFTLPSGSYATVVLGEIMKTDVPVD